MKTKQKQIKKPIRKTTSTRAKATRTISARSTRKGSTVARRKTSGARAKAAAVTRKRVVKAKTQIKTARKHAKKVLVPHRENEYRPHLIRAHGIIAVLIVALLAQIVYSFMTTGHLDVLGRVSNIQTTELLASTNVERTQRGLGELEINAQLSDAAFLKAQNMFNEQYWAHVSPSGIQPWKWFGDVGYNYSYAGENLAKNYPTAQATVEAWMNSPSHRENVLKAQYKDVGFAVVDGELHGKQTTLVVALYGAPVTVAAVQSATTAPQATFSTSVTASTVQNPIAYFGSALESLSPVTIVILGLLAVVAIVGVAAHHYRAQLPKAWRRKWRMHHGMFTFVGMLLLGVMIIIATGGGSL